MAEWQYTRDGALVTEGFEFPYDTDGDGKADKVTVFADHLNIPTGFVFVNGGILLAQAPHFLFLADTKFIL